MLRVLSLARWRWLLVVPALAALLCGVMSGLARLGVLVPDFFLRLVGIHGALMIGGFFGTLIGLERAVALAARWPYLAPLCSGLAVLLLIWLPAGIAGVWLMALAALWMSLACAWVWRRQRVAHHATLAAGALAWLLGNIVWALGGTLVAAVPLWTTFLILTIAGERLELSRFVPTPARARRLFFGIVVLLLGSAFAAVFLDDALRVYALSLLLLAAWLLRYDIARRTIHSAGLTRYMALCLLSGYFWLGFSALLGLAGALVTGSLLRDAALHALLLGFVFAMVFGHAPVIVPALTRHKMRWHRGFYLPLLILHATLLLRVLTACGGDFVWRQWAALGNAAALSLFMLMVLESLLAAARAANVKRR
ncbi:hypothetical protein GCM10027046_13260 [Uliginosibacterium flavum]